jgi:hypothetical protein
MLERDKPDLIVSSDQLGDMSGRDLYEIVRSDPALNSVNFILLDGTPQNKIPDSPKDLELSWMTSASDIVKAAKDLLGMNKAPLLSGPPAASINISKGQLQPREAPVNPDFDAGPSMPVTKSVFPSKAISSSKTGEGGMKSRQVGASGTLEIFTLFDLAVSLTSNLKVGKLYVRIIEEEGMIFFYKGALTHAEYKMLTGESALLKIFADADEFKSDTEFLFEPLETSELPKAFHTITNTIDKLLFNVAVELDHQREAKARAKEAQKA